MISRRVPLAALSVALLMLIPAASAVNLGESDLPYTDTINQALVKEYKSSFAYTVGTIYHETPYPLAIYAPHIERWGTLTFVSAVTTRDIGTETNGQTVYYKRPSDNTVHTASLYVQKSRNLLGQVQSTMITIFPHDWEVGTATGGKLIDIYSNSAATTKYQMTCWIGDSVGHLTSATDFIGPVIDYPKSGNYAKPIDTGTVTYAAIGSQIFQHDITLDRLSSGHISVDVNKYGIYSTISGTADGVNVFNISTADDFSSIISPYANNATVSIIAPNYVKNYCISSTSETPSSPANTTVNVYVRSSQTGALLAGAHLLLEGALGVDGWSEYYNGTLPSGSAEFSLPTTTEATPYQFRVTATYPSYMEVTPLQYFNTFRPRNIIIEMEPAAVAPTDPEKTFLVFYVRDVSANPLPGAVIEVDDQWLYTNNNGYARFEVLKNATYPYKVSKSGYMTIQGSANVESEGSYTVNVVLGQGSIPTLTPTSAPGETPGATPTPTSTGWGEGQWTPDPGADLGDNARGAAKSTLLQGLQAGQMLFMVCILMLIMAVVKRGGK